MTIAASDTPIPKRTLAACDSLHSVIGYYVLSELGRPREFNRIDVHPLWKDHYRVNVVVGGLDSYSWRIAHSYYVVADNNGKICATTPPLRKTYKFDQAIDN